MSICYLAFDGINVYITVLLALLCYSFQGPMVKARVAANLRKRSLIEGTFGTFDATKGESNTYIAI